MKERAVLELAGTLLVLDQCLVLMLNTLSVYVCLKLYKKQAVSDVVIHTSLGALHVRELRLEVDHFEPHSLVFEFDPRRDGLISMTGCR